MSIMEELNAMVKSAAWYNPFSWGSGPKPGTTRDEQAASRMGVQPSDVQRWRQMKPQTYLPKPGTRDPELPKLFPGRPQDFWDRTYAKWDRYNNAKSTQMMYDATDPVKNTPYSRAQKAMEYGENDFTSRYMRALAAKGITGQDAYNRAMAAQQINKKYYTMGRDGKYVMKNPADRERARIEYNQIIAKLNAGKANGVAQVPAANPAGRPGAV